MAETAIKDKAVAWLRQQGSYVIKLHGEAMQERGIPDLVGMLPGGRGFALEMKQPGEGPSKLQEYHLDLVRKAGGAAGVAHNLDEVREWFHKETALRLGPS